jgi:hypothetical protein
VPVDSADEIQSSRSTHGPSDSRTPTQTISLVVETTKPQLARGARVVVEPQRVLAWNLEER